MKWKTTELPEAGDIRYRTVFAWIPIPCEDGQTRWLEHVLVKEKFMLTMEGDYCWRPLEAEGL